MPSTPVILTITVWDDHVRISMMSKAMVCLASRSFYLTINTDTQGIRSVDPFQIIYFIRTGIQQLMGLDGPVITSIGVASMPGYVMPWYRKNGTPIGNMLVPNNSLTSLAYQEFKFSEFYSLLSCNPVFGALNTPNLPLNLWVLAKQNIPRDGVIYSGVDTWINYLLTGHNEQSLVTSPDMVSELLIEGNRWDPTILNAISLNESTMPTLATNPELLVHNFFPLHDGVPIHHNGSTQAMLSDMLDAYSRDSVAFVQLSNINYLTVNRRTAGVGTESVRFSGLRALQHSFQLPTTIDAPSLNVDDIQDDMLMATNPFQSFYNQVYHLKNVANALPDTLGRLGMLNTLFLIKYLLAKFEKKTAAGHIKTVILSACE
ncbi:MAG: hypothetical protein ACO3K7_01100, partial [Candidatus Marinamargulisbacteria bacterium]